MRRRLLLTGAVAGVGVAGLAGAAAVLLRRPAPAAQGTQRPIATVTVERQDLIEVRTVPGKMGYGPVKGVASRLAGTITALPALGEVIERGRTLFRIDDEPVTLLYGTLPAYRTLAPAGTATGGGTASGGTGTGGTAAEGSAAAEGSEAAPASKGADVKQLKENLRALGYSVNSDDVYGTSTANAVRKWQKDLGLPQTGVVELGRVHYAAGPVRVAEHKLEPGVEASGPVLTTTGTARMVTATVKVFDAELAKPGTKAKIESNSGKQIDGGVVSLSTPDGEGRGDDPVLEATLSLEDQAAAAGLDGPLRVMFTARERTGVLVVPVGALVALAEGGFGLQVVEAGGATGYIAVTAGLFANGKVEVEGAGLTEGMTVGMAQ